MAYIPSSVAAIQSPQALSEVLDNLLPQLQSLSVANDVAGQYPATSFELLRRAELLTVVLPQPHGGLGF